MRRASVLRTLVSPIYWNRLANMGSSKDAVDKERKCHFEDQRGELSQALDTYYQSLRFIEYHGWIASPESLVKYECSEDFMGTNRNT